MTDLTAITTPFGLLDRETQEALKDHCGPWEVFTDRGWEKPSEPAGWYASRAYRVKPAPREWWAVGLHLHNSEADAQRFLAELSAEHPRLNFGAVIHVREVLP